MPQYNPISKEGFEISNMRPKRVSQDEEYEKLEQSDEEII